jgi:hypothetical protein
MEPVKVQMSVCELRSANLSICDCQSFWVITSVVSNIQESLVESKSFDISVECAHPC